MGQFFKYIGLLFNRAAAKSVTLTDRLTILLVPFTTLVLWMTGAKMTETIQETLALGVAITVMAVVILRFVAASYFVWKEDQQEKASLNAEIARPAREIEITMKQFTTRVRQELSNKLARLSAIANLTRENFQAMGTTADEVNKLSIDIDTLINQISYDVPARISAIHLKDYCLDLIVGSKSNRARLWAQRKLTFRILHKENYINDIFSLAELEILIEDDEGVENVFSGKEGVFAEIKEKIRLLGNRFHDSDVANEMRKTARGEDWLA